MNIAEKDGPKEIRVVDPSCKTCKFWRPNFYMQGHCSREGFAHSKIFSRNPESQVITHSTFLCSEYSEVPVEETETI